LMAPFEQRDAAGRLKMGDDGPGARPKDLLAAAILETP
jgi:hypothetical protein